MFIQVELKVIEVHAPALARAMGVDTAQVVGSLALLWHRCWSTKSDSVLPLELRGFFPHPDAGPLLAAFGFLEDAGGTWRVRGAERYLRITEQRREAGAARAKAAARAGGRFTSGAPAKRQRRTSGPPADDQRSTSGQPALTPNTEHRTPNTERTTLAPAARAPSVTREVTDALCAEFATAVGEPYRWQGAKDGAALSGLLKTATTEQVLERWRAGLRATGWHQVRTVAQLASKWNDLAGGTPKAVARGPVAAESVDWSDAEVGEIQI